MAHRHRPPLEADLARAEERHRTTGKPLPDAIVLPQDGRIRMNLQGRT